MNLFNTSWTLCDEGYYRIDHGKLVYAPINNIDFTVDISQETEVDIVTPEQLEKINQILGTHYTIDEINSL